MGISNIFILALLVILMGSTNVNADGNQRNPSETTKAPQFNPSEDLIFNQNELNGTKYNKSHEKTLSRVKRQVWRRGRYPLLIFVGGIGTPAFGTRGFGRGIGRPVFAGRGFGRFGGRGVGGFGGRGIGGFGGRGVGGFGGRGGFGGLGGRGGRG